MNEDKLTGYELSRDWFDFCFENPEIIHPTHTAMYFFIIEHCNRLGWKDKFGLPMEMTKDAIGIKNYKTFSRTFNDLVEWNFIKVFQKSKNQYSANIIGLVKNTKATTKALTKAISKHDQKQVHDNVGIDKLKNSITKEQKEYIYSPFYDFQIEESKKEETNKNYISDYLNFVKYIFGSNELEKPLNDILAITDQLKFADFVKLLNKAISNKNKLREILLQLDNDKKYTNGKKSLYTTLDKWVSTNFDKKIIAEDSPFKSNAVERLKQKILLT